MCAYRRLDINTTHHTYVWVLSSHLHQFVPNQQGVATGAGQQDQWGKVQSGINMYLCVCVCVCVCVCLSVCLSVFCVCMFGCVVCT